MTVPSTSFNLEGSGLWDICMSQLGIEQKDPTEPIFDYFGPGKHLMPNHSLYDTVYDMQKKQTAYMIPLEQIMQVLTQLFTGIMQGTSDNS